MPSASAPRLLTLSEPLLMLGCPQWLAQAFHLCALWFSGYGWGQQMYFLQKAWPFLCLDDSEAFLKLHVAVL